MDVQIQRKYAVTLDSNAGQRNRYFPDCKYSRGDGTIGFVFLHSKIKYVWNQIKLQIQHSYKYKEKYSITFG